MTTMDQAGFSQRESVFRLRGRVAFGFLTMLALVGGVGYWSTSTLISGAIISSGSVKVVDEVKHVQHRDGGIIADIEVERGERVAAGQVLVRLDDAQTNAELAIIRGQLDELSGRRTRLLAERDGVATLTFPATFSEPNARLAELMAGESQLFTGNLLGRSRLKEQLVLQEEQLGQEIIGLEAQLGAISEEVTMVQEELQRLVKLTDQGLVEGSRVYSVNREVARMEGQRGEIEAAIARARGRVGEVQLQKLSIDETARNEAQRELRQLDASVGELIERKVAVEDRLSRTEIRSPIDGIVNEISVTTIGGVITPAETLMTIVPADADLTVEFRLRTVDVDQIQAGQPAKLRFSAFNQRTTPEVPGIVTRVAAAAQIDPSTGETYYLGDVSFDASALDAQLELRPGMPVEVFVETQRMSPLSYLAKPFTDQVARAFREE